MVAAWERALPWLLRCSFCGTTAAQVAELAAYCATYPQHLKADNMEGRLPMHCTNAYQRGEHAVAVIGALLRTPPEAPQGKDKEGQLLLHHLATWVQRGDHGEAVVAALLKTYPEAAMATGQFGCLALYQACIGDDKLAVLKALLAACPLAAQVKDSFGNSPLHYAAQYQAGEYGVAVIELLLAVYPQAVVTPNGLGKLPLQLARGNPGLPLAGVQLLVQTAVNITQQQSAIGAHVSDHIAADN